MLCKGVSVLTIQTPYKQNYPLNNHQSTPLKLKTIKITSCKNNLHSCGISHEYYKPYNMTSSCKGQWKIYI